MQPTQPKDVTSANVVWHEGAVSRETRHSVLKQKGITLWFTGLSGSGKSTIAVALEKALLDRGHASYRLDGDNVRMGLCRDLGFSSKDREENIRRIGEVCKLFADSGVIVLASFISPYKADRHRVRRIHDESGLDFVECHVNCPLNVAEDRDPKGLYKKARAGEIRGFTGIDDPYEPPDHAEVCLQTDKVTVDESVSRLLSHLDSIGVFKP